jgi:hypothetical protein
MKFIARVILFVLVAGLSVCPAIIGCDEETKSNNKLWMLTMAFINTNTPDKIYIYNGGLHDPYLADRSTADSICQTAASGFTVLSGKSVKKAFISFSSDDMRDLVASQYKGLPVYGVTTDGTETLLKDTWNNLWAATGINDTLQNATGITDGWWSGSTNDGVFSGPDSSCRQWTCNANPCTFPASGTAGKYGDNTGTEWLNQGSYACNSTVHVLCVAY